MRRKKESLSERARFLPQPLDLKPKTSPHHAVISPRRQFNLLIRSYRVRLPIRQMDFCLSIREILEGHTKGSSLGCRLRQGLSCFGKVSFLSL